VPTEEAWPSHWKDPDHEGREDQEYRRHDDPTVELDAHYAFLGIVYDSYGSDIGNTVCKRHR
jgi:hypothetical protein